MEPVLPFHLTLASTPPGGPTRSLQRQLRAAVLDGRLPVGFALPSTRRLAATLGIGRNTVIAAYESLVVEGHAQSRPGGRTVVISGRQVRDARTAVSSGDRPDARIAAAWRHAVHRVEPGADLAARGFRIGVPEHRHFPHAQWRRLMARSLREAARSGFVYGDPQGLPELREAIARHVAFVRAVACGTDDLVVTSGAQQAFDLLARLLVTPGRTRVAVEEPGYPPLRSAFAAAGATLVPVPVDAEGLRVDRLPDGVRVVCLTPSHQFPTGAVMSAARRAALLERARALNAVIVEDDYDGEFLFDARPQDALQTLDRDSRVFYVGTFSKSLFPALRKGFVVAPVWARAALVEVKRCADWHSDAITQSVLAAFITEGHLARHIRRMRRVYAERREALVHAMQQHLWPYLEPLPGSAGLHIAVRILTSQDAERIVQATHQHTPGALPMSVFSMRRSATSALCFGYGTIEADEIGIALRRLGQALAMRTR